MSLDRMLEKATYPDGRKRFWPHGKHPAGESHRRWLVRWAELGGAPDAPEAMHVKEDLAVLEETEARSKADFLRLARRMCDDGDPED